MVVLSIIKFVQSLVLLKYNYIIFLEMFVTQMSIWCCVAWFSSDIFFTSSSIIHLCIISIDRYVVLRNPFKSYRYQTKCLKIGLICSWLVPAAVAGPLFVLTYSIQIHEKQSYKGCGPNAAYFVIFATVMTFFLPLLIMTVTYTLTVVSLFKQNKKTRGTYIIYIYIYNTIIFL